MSYVIYSQTQVGDYLYLVGKSMIALSQYQTHPELQQCGPVLGWNLNFIMSWVSAKMFMECINSIKAQNYKSHQQLHIIFINTLR